MRITAPAPNSRHLIAADTTPPTIVFTTDTPGPTTWNWSISWRHFQKTGQVQTPGNTWRAHTEFADVGGTLTVRASNGSQQTQVVVTIAGTNPLAADVRAYLMTRPDADGFYAIIDHETHCRHFNAQGEPIRSFDNGYGMTQLTNPAPTYEQAWNWKHNVLGGLALFAGKRTAAINYLRQNNRSYTNAQLRFETVARWNGGAYHQWNTTSGAWERNADILCDPATGNIGWRMSDADNAGQTLQQLRARDSGAFAQPRPAGANWIYSGVCYADRVLD